MSSFWQFFDIQMTIFLRVSSSHSPPVYADLQLQFSLDKGKSWHQFLPACLPSMVTCGQYHHSAVFTSDLYSGWNRISVPVPQPAWSVSASVFNVIIFCLYVYIKPRIYENMTSYKIPTKPIFNNFT